MTAREKIVAAAFDQFHAVGFADCSVQDIVVAARVPKGSFYNYFKSKEILAVEILGLYLDLILSILAASKQKDPVERMKAFFVAAMTQYAGNRFQKGCLMGNFAADVSDAYPDLRTALAKAFVTWNKALTALVKEAQAQGNINSRHDPVRLARFLINSWQGAALRVKVDRSRRSIDDFLEVTFDALR